MSSFFTLPASQRKRKRADRAAAPSSKKQKNTTNSDFGDRSARRDRQERDESISGSESEGDDSAARVTSEDEATSESDEGETAAERRLRLAERYLETLKEEVDEVGFDAAELDRDLIAERLKEDVVRWF
jgi:ribosomal RNA-processing protein 9